jgi:hypothetical protein
MAVWCLLTRQTPHVYRELTNLEREQFFEAGKKFNGVK